jgi:mRNA interferase RelE/StbE
LTWTVEFKASVEKDLRAVDPQSAERILSFLAEKVASGPKALGGPLKGVRLWRYRVGPFRIICKLNEKEHRVVVLRIGHRRDVYRGL